MKAVVSALIRVTVWTAPPLFCRPCVSSWPQQESILVILLLLVVSAVVVVVVVVVGVRCCAARILIVQCSTRHIVSLASRPDDDSKLVIFG